MHNQVTSLLFHGLQGFSPHSHIEDLCLDDTCAVFHPKVHEPLLVLQVNVGIGTLAGSTIMLLTVAWGGSLIAGRCDLNDKACHCLWNLSFLYCPRLSLIWSCIAQQLKCTQMEV